jgi:hypothetical protein
MAGEFCGIDERYQCSRAGDLLVCPGSTYLIYGGFVDRRIRQI